MHRGSIQVVGRTLTMSAVALFTWAAMSSADTKVYCFPFGTFVWFQYSFPPAAVKNELYFNFGTSDFCKTIIRANPLPNTFDHVISSGCCVTVGGKRQVKSYGIAVGNATKGIEGGIHVSALGDTAYAQDSLEVRVLPGATTDTIRILSGVIQNNKDSRGAFTLAVYPDSASAVADSAAVGTGATLYGKATMNIAGKVLATGAFRESDFTIVHNPDGSISAIPTVNLTKVASGIDPTKATIKVITDPDAGLTERPTPGASPLGLTLMSLAMMGSAIAYLGWRRRTGTF